MRLVLADISASITELKKNPSALLKRASGEPVVILNHNKPTAYLIPAEAFESLMDQLENLELASMVRERKAEKPQAIDIDIDEL